MNFPLIWSKGDQRYDYTHITGIIMVQLRRSKCAKQLANDRIGGVFSFHAHSRVPGNCKSHTRWWTIDSYLNNIFAGWRTMNFRSWNIVHDARRRSVGLPLSTNCTIASSSSSPLVAAAMMPPPPQIRSNSIVDQLWPINTLDIMKNTCMHHALRDGADRLTMSAFLSKQIFGKVGSLRKLSQAGFVPSRKLNLLEYQSKKLLQDCGVSVQDFTILDDLNKAPSALDKFHVDEYVIKAQVLAGGRGKGWFDNGFKGGVHLTKDRNAVLDIAKSMLGHRLITKQTHKDGILVQKVMIAESVDIKRETYVCILMDRQYNGPVLIASPQGGMDIEAVAEKTPEALKTIPLDIYYGIDDSIASEVASFLGFTEKEIHEKAVHELKNLWRLFVDIDALQIEINPLVETANKDVVAVDAKISFDDNAQFRQKDIFDLEDVTEKDPAEVAAAKYNLNYISMGGNIGCLVNGAGLAMATMDIIKLNGGEPANFLDVGGGVTEDQVFNAFKIVAEDPKAQAIFVNVFGGIVNCATIAKGIVAAARSLGMKRPVIVRLEGTNVNAARKILEDSGLPFTMENNFDEAAKKAVASTKA